MDKILAEASVTETNKDHNGSETGPQNLEEPMEANTGESQDPEVEMAPEEPSAQ